MRIGRAVVVRACAPAGSTGVLGVVGRGCPARSVLAASAMRVVIVVGAVIGVVGRGLAFV